MRVFTFHHYRIAAFVALTVFLPHAPVLAQRPPTMPPSTISATTLTEEQLAQIKAYAEYYTGILKNAASKPEEVESARVELVKPVSTPPVSGLFRLEYGKFVAAELDQVLTAGSIHAGVNAMIVASDIGGDRCTTFLTRNADRESQSKWQWRLQAAFGCVKVLKGETLEVRNVQRAVSALRIAAGVEDHALILRHHLTAIDAADHNPNMAPEDRKQLRATLVDTIGLVVGEMAKDPKRQTKEMLAAIADGIVNMVRKKFVDGTMDAVEQRAHGPKIAMAIGGALAMAQKNWEAGQGDPREKRAYAVMIGGWEGFLPSVDKAVRGGSSVSSKLRAAWDAGDKAAFDAELAKWNMVLKQPPYTP